MKYFIDLELGLIYICALYRRMYIDLCMSMCTDIHLAHACASLCPHTHAHTHTLNTRNRKWVNMGDSPLVTSSEIRLSEISHHAFFPIMRKHPRVAGTLVLETLDSERGLEGTGKNALALQSVEQQSRSCDLVESHLPPAPSYQDNELRPPRHTQGRQRLKNLQLTNPDKLVM